MASTEPSSSIPIDVRTLDTDSLRRLIQQSRAVLRNRHLIPDATVRKATTPTPTDDERAAIRRAARREILTGRATHSGGYPHSHQTGWSRPLIRAIGLFLVGTNLIEPDLETADPLNISLREVWDRYCEHEHRVNLRAGQLRAAVTARFGFQEIRWNEEKAWVRTDPPLPPRVAAYQVRELVKKQPHVLITEGCRIYVNGTYRCVVEGQSADLPHADQVVRRLLAVATPHRERIHTLTADLPLLTALFTPYRHARLGDLVSEIPETPSTLHEHEKEDS